MGRETRWFFVETDPFFKTVCSVLKCLKKKNHPNLAFSFLLGCSPRVENAFRDTKTRRARHLLPARRTSPRPRTRRVSASRRLTPRSPRASVSRHGRGARVRADAPPSPPPPSRPLASVDPDDIATLSDAAARELQMKRENLKLAMMELDLAERREKIANQQAERALQIKERELELAERERALNPPPPPPPPPAPAPRRRRRSRTSGSAARWASPSRPRTPSSGRRSSSCRP